MARLVDQLQRIRKVIKRSITFKGHKTSVSLETEFWLGLQEIARYENTSVTVLVERIDRERDNGNLSSAIRVFVFNYFRSKTPHGEGVTPTH